LNDRELLDKIKNPDSRNYGFNLLVRKYQQKLYWHIRKMVIDHDDTDDIMQDVFVKVWHHLDNFRADAQLYTWIYRIATNECLNFLRKKRNRYFLPIHDIQGELTQKIESGPYIDGNEVQIKLQKALLTLPDKQRLVFNLKYFDELKYEEMAEITGTSIGSLKASYHHAVKKIEEFLNKD
jgi:RNA polymerase sigma-70 factor (ECF subfamily)